VRIVFGGGSEKYFFLFLKWIPKINKKKKKKKTLQKNLHKNQSKAIVLSANAGSPKKQVAKKLTAKAQKKWVMSKMSDAEKMSDEQKIKKLISYFSSKLRWQQVAEKMSDEQKKVITSF